MSTENFGPLQGIRVIEMGQLLAGPFVGSRLADFGAEVIKIETPGAGDPMRSGDIIGIKESHFGGLHWLETKNL